MYALPELHRLFPVVPKSRGPYPWHYRKGASKHPRLELSRSSGKMSNCPIGSAAEVTGVKRHYHVKPLHVTAQPCVLAQGDEQCTLACSIAAASVKCVGRLARSLFDAGSRVQDDLNLPGRSVFAINVAFGAVLFVALTYVGSNMLFRVIRCTREGRVW
jgi:hypothetical protein